MKVESGKWKVETKKSARFGADGDKMSQVITFYFSNRGRRGTIRYLEGVWSYGSKHSVRCLNNEH